MKQMRQRRWLSGSLVAGLAVAAMVHGSAPMEVNGAYPVKKSEIGLTQLVSEGVETIISSNPGSANPGTVIVGGAGNVNSSTGNNVIVGGADNTNSGSTGSNVIVSGGAGNKNTGSGPSIHSGIVTEGEKAQMGQQLPQESLLGGATLTMLQSQSNSQMLSAILQTSQGKLIVVDGGLGADGDYLRSQIQARGGHVAAWLITHPHGDHVGALYRILQDEANGIPSNITIDGIYYSFAAPEWYTIHDPSEMTMAHSIIGTFAGLPQTMLHTVSRGQTIQVDDVTIQVMNDRYELSNDKGNNASIVYKVYVGGKSILFLGDLGLDGGNRLLNESGAQMLKSDIVQMAHHGQGAAGEELYKAIDPSICLWPTPQWLWNNTEGRYKIAQTKSWMSRLNVQRHYSTKDGDQVIR